MDSLAYAKTHEPEWDRLEALARQRRLSGAESDELIQLYQRAAGQLAQIRTNAPDPDLVLKLSAVLGRARSRLTSVPVTPWRAILSFFTETLPLSFYRIRHWIWVVTAVCVGLFILTLTMYALNPSLMETLGSYSDQQAYAKQAFEAYYSEHPHADFTALVWTNNAWIALQCVAGGFTGLFPIYVLFQNSVAVGQAGAIMHRFDNLDLFFQLILPHGQLELMAIFVAGAAGLRVFWAIVAPGPMPRTTSLGREGRHTIMVGIGLVFVLFVSGLLEGFVTPSLLPWPAKIAIGTLALSAFWVWVMYFGHRATALGLAKDRPSETGWHLTYTGE